MKVLEEIHNNSKEEDKPILLWLFNNYSIRSQWSFVAFCVHESYGKLSYETNRVWKPTIEGKALYEYFTQCSK